MNKISVSYVNLLCTKLEGYANKNIRRKNFNRAIRLLKSLSYLRYKFHLGYRNDFIEEQIKIIAQDIVRTPFVENNNDKSIAIIDEINADYIGLMTQYLAPFISAGYQILYIYEQIEHKGVVRANLMHTLISCKNAKIKEIPLRKKGFAKSQWIYNQVCAFGAKKVLMNFGEWAVEHCVACYALPDECKKYHINAGDHCFWAGVCCVDFSFELRHYGANLSFKERGLGKEQIVYQPFYPVMKKVPFQEFPVECDGKFIFLSGGAIYKIMDEEKTFFRLCKKILDECPNAIIIYAGAVAYNIDNDVLTDGINQFGLQGRFISIGYRNDILEVIKHCDAYINTYPISGGLMCQYAAQCSKPIINYIYPGVEECVAQKAECHFTFYTEDDFLQEAFRLYNESTYCKSRGAAMREAVVSKEEFDNALLSFISSNKRVFEVKWNDDFLPRTLSTDDAINYNNKVLYNFYSGLLRLLDCDSIWIMFGNYISFNIIRCKRKLINILKNKILWQEKKN